MKIILTESQYNKLLDDSKKKVVITESQYNKLLTEIYMTENINEIKKNNSIVINKENDDKLFFEVIDSENGGLLMVNTNKGSALTGSYFYITSDDLSNGDLTYKFAYKKSVGVLTKIDITQIDTWKEATLKNIKYFGVFRDNTNTDLLFTINAETGKKETLNPKIKKGDVSKSIKASDRIKKAIIDKPNDFLSLLGVQNKGTLRSKEILDKWGQGVNTYDNYSSSKSSKEGNVVEFKIIKENKINDQNEYDKFIKLLNNNISKGRLKKYKFPTIDFIKNGFYFKLILAQKINNPNSINDIFKAKVYTGPKGSLKVIAEVELEITKYNA
jgi:hypothetical protein